MQREGYHGYKKGVYFYIKVSSNTYQILSQVNLDHPGYKNNTDRRYIFFLYSGFYLTGALHPVAGF